MICIKSVSPVLFALTLGGCGTVATGSGPWNQIRVGNENGVPPFEYADGQGSRTGLNIELINAACAAVGSHCPIVETPYATNIDALEANKIDLILPMTDTEARRQRVAFTEVLYPLQSQLVAAKGSGLMATAQSLRGKRVGVLAGTVREAYARARWEPQGVTIISYELNSQLIRDLQAQRIDATLQDIVEINFAFLNTSQGQGYELAGQPLDDPMLGVGPSIAVRKNNPELVALINSGLERIKQNGQYQAIVSRYLPATPSSPNPIIFTPGTANLPFSEAAQVGRTLYLSGILGLGANGDIVPGGIRAETNAAMNQLRDIVERHGGSMSQVAKCTVILADINDFSAMNEVYARYFPEGKRPTRTTFQAGKLIGNARVEIECLALI